MIVVPASLLKEVLERARQHRPTYPDEGQTGAGDLPTGYRHDRRALQVGHGDADWRRAQEALRLWKGHQHAGAVITPADASLDPGNTVLAGWRVGPLVLVAPCRIVYRTDTPDRFGFAYGTLPGHPEQGEEAFHVVRHDDGTITAEIVAFSRPADLTARLAGPVARLVQTAAMRRYLDGIREHVHRGN